jgi:hypothetical protein
MVPIHGDCTDGVVPEEWALGLFITATPLKVWGNSRAAAQTSAMTLRMARADGSGESGGSAIFFRPPCAPPLAQSLAVRSATGETWGGAEACRRAIAAAVAASSDALVYGKPILL